MKKISVVMMAFMLSAFVSCNNNPKATVVETAKDTTEVVVDSMAVDSVAVDSAVVTK